MKEESMSDYTGLLYATPSALDGFGGVLDIGVVPTEYNTFGSSEEADYEALRSDWRAVGQDIRQALDRFKREQER